ncbi:hypothetical protein [Microbacterium enclense]|uniref:hypothetical protein n=1 Tax=Microbacterium enclense TaxID=993073 RepID=UPI00111397C1|nr:hypothetical protein [Microbacterium enclense]
MAKKIDPQQLSAPEFRNTGKTLAPEVALPPDGASDGANRVDDLIDESWTDSEVAALVAGI